MFKLLNRFAWVLSITIWIAIFAIDNDYFFVAIIIWFIIKYFILSDKFIEARLEYFANSLKENYLNYNKENTTRVFSPLSTINKENTTNLDNQEKLKEKEVINLQEIEEQARIEELKEKEENQKEYEEIMKQKKLEEKENIEDLKNSRNYTQYNTEPSVLEIFFQKIWNYIKDFFSTNLLAKLGWILVFLAVVYFLKGFVGDLWEAIWPNGRLLVWIIAWFATYFAWVKIHSKYENEWLILMWTWILINFAVILSGRYLVWNWGYLSEGLTFVFLILNTIFSVLTSLIYKSNTLLIFSFIFAYLNPFIIWAKSDWNPYTLIWYSFIVSLWGLYISIKQVNLTLLAISFILGNLLFLAAPFSDSLWWSSKIILTSLFSFITIFFANKFEWLNKYTKKTSLYLFSGTYLFIILHLLNSSSFLSETLSFIVYNSILIWLFVFTVKLIKNLKTSWNDILNVFLFLPLFILVWILFSWNLIFAPFVLIWTIIFYLLAFSFLSITWVLAYAFFGILGIFIFLFNLNIWTFSKPTNIEFFSLIWTSLLFLFSSYYYSLQEKKENLFTVWTIWTILILAPIIQKNWEFLNLSVLAVIIFGILNLILPIINKNLLNSKNIYSLLIWSLAWALFFAFQIYNFWELYFPWVTEWFAFLALAITYFAQAFFLSQKLGIENIKKDSWLQNIIYSFLWISISLFSVAMAFVFANHPEIITTTWLFEATILYFFYFKTWSQKIFYWATILFLIWILKFGVLVDVVGQKEYSFLVSFTLILASFILNLDFINKTENKSFHNIHHILHILWMWIMGFLLVKIIPFTIHWWIILGISIFITIIWSFYAKFNFTLLKIFFVFLIIWLSIIHIWWLKYIFWKLENDNLEYLKIMQYFVSTIIISNYFIWKKLNQKNIFNKIILAIVSIYAFIISNLYVIDLFSHIFHSFTLTIYWWLIASGLLYYWIQKDIIKYRTIWLYFLTLTTLKIFAYDVWVNFWDTNSRIAVLWVLWVIFIIISTLYTKKYWDNLLKEFSLKNLKNNSKNKDLQTKKEEEENNFIINKEIKNIDVSDIKSVKFNFNNWKSIRIRAENLIKISKLVVDKFDWKTNFSPNELSETFEFIKQNYKTELSKDNYKKILEIMKKFVEFWWKVEFIKK